MASEKFEVVVAGVSGDYPECDNFHEFSELLFSGKSGVTVDETRWPSGAMDTPPGLGKIPSYKEMDSTFFGMTPGLTMCTDPLTRLTLETSVEALIDAGINPSDLSGTNTGVIVGSCVSECEFIQLFSAKKFAILGANRAMQANRTSFFLNLTGPSFQMDATWTGGLQCLELAKRLIEEGSVEGCIVAAANLTISPCVSKQMQGLGCLSNDEYTRSFSKDATGYVRAEAAVAFYLTRIENAKRSYGSVEEVAVKTFGGKNGIFAANDSPNDFEDLMKSVYSKIDSNQVGYVEADGSAIKKLDVMECSAMKQIFHKNKKRSSPLLIGSVKSVVGHAEAASSLVSVSKALVILDSGVIPANLNYSGPNPDAPGLSTGEFTVVTKKTPLPGKLVGVTSIGLCGAFGHMVLKQFSKVKKHIYKKYEMYLDQLPRLILISGRTETGLRNILKKVKDYPADEEFAALFHEVFKKSVNQHNIRGYVLTPNTSPDDENLEHLEYYDGLKRPIWFIFSGMGSQWNGMGIDLLKIPIFRRTVEKLDAVLKPKGVDIFHILTSKDDALFDNILNSFVGIAACQIGLVDILFALGIQPDGILGHSVGELGCAYADGCFTAEQMILSAYARGRASLETDTIEGKMAAIGLGYTEMKERLKNNDRIQIACHNAKDSCTLSGPSKDIEEMVVQLVAEGVFARSVNVANIAYHSKYIAPAAPKLLAYLKEVIPAPKERSSKWISSSILEENWDSDLAKTSSPEYHTNNLLSSVYFEEACVNIPNNAICIEIAPHGLLQAILKRSLNDACTNVPLTLKNVNDGVKFLLDKIGRLYLLGLDIDLLPLYPEVSFPVSRGTKPLGQFVDWDHSHQYDLEGLEVTTKVRSERMFQISMIDHILYRTHQINGVHVLPSSSMLYLVLETLALVSQRTPFKDALVMQNVQFHQSVKNSSKRSTKLYSLINKGSGYFELLHNIPGNEYILASGNVNYMTDIMEYEQYKFIDTVCVAPRDKIVEQISGDEVYAYLKQYGMAQGTECQKIKQISIYEKNIVVASVEYVPNDLITLLENILTIPTYIHVEKHSEAYVPWKIESILINKEVLMTSIETSNNNLMDVFYDMNSNVIQCYGVHMYNICMKPVLDIPLANSILNVKSVTFVPYNNAVIFSLSQYTLICLQILLENIPPIEKGFKINLNIVNLSKHNLLTELINLLNIQPHIEYKIINSNLINEQGKIHQSDSNSFNFIINDDDNLKHSFNILNSNKYSYLLIKILKHECLNLNDNCIIISRQIIDNYKYFFIKNNYNNNKKIGRGVVFSMNVNDSQDWTNELKRKINEAIIDNSCVYVVQDTQPSCSINEFIKKYFVHEQYFRTNFQFLKFFFIFDKSAPLFSVIGKFYQDQINKDVLVNIYKNGKWGSEKFVLNEKYSVVKYAYDQCHQYNESEYLNSKVSTDKSSVDIKYLCISNKNLIVDESCKSNKKAFELGPLEYAGNKSNGQHVVGLAPFHKGISKIQQDDILQWTLPNHWKLEDGVTIPLPYSFAYHILNKRYFLYFVKYEYVLLNTGLNAIGLAFLNIFVHRTNQHRKIFLSVKNEKQKQYVEEKYRKFIDDDYLQVLVYTKTSVEVSVMFGIRAKGCRLVINGLSGKYMQDALKCCCVHARFIQLNKKDAIERSKLGLSVFIQNLEVASYTPDEMFRLNDERKRQLKKIVQHEIDSGVIKSIPKTVVTGPHTGEEALRKLDSALEGDNFERIVLSLERERPKSLMTSPSSRTKYTFESEKSYLIIGGKLGTWLELAEFLMIRGVTHILLALEKHAMTTCASRKLNHLLINYPKASIQMMSANKLDSQIGTLSLIEQCSLIHQLGLVFLLNIESESKLKNIHSCLQNKVHEYVVLVSIYCRDTSLCEVRKLNGYSTLCIQTEVNNNSSTDEVLNVLDTLLVNVNSKQDAAPIIMINDIATHQNDSEYILLQNLKTHLPESLEELKELSEHIPSVPHWEEVQTRCSRYKDAIGSYPVFLIPGLRSHSKLLDKFTKKLYHPCFVAQYPGNFDNLEETANIFIRELGSFPVRTFNIIADSFGGILALHIAKKLTQENRYVRLFLLDGAPHTIKSWVSYFDENPEVKLLSKYFSITVKEKEEILSLSWTDKLKRYIDEEHPEFEKFSKSLTCLLEKIKSMKTSILNTSKDVELMPYVQVVLLRPEGWAENDTCYLEKICAGRIIVYVGSCSNYLDFLDDPETVARVNDHILYDYPESETPLYYMTDQEQVYNCKLFHKRV